VKKRTKNYFVHCLTPSIGKQLDPNETSDSAIPTDPASHSDPSCLTLTTVSQKLEKFVTPKVEIRKNLRMHKTYLSVKGLIVFNIYMMFYMESQISIILFV